MGDRSIIDWRAWSASPPGRYILGWEQAQLDQTVTDIFGYHAVQLGAPELDGLRENRMTGRALALDPANANSAACLPRRGKEGPALPRVDDRWPATQTDLANPALPASGDANRNMGEPLGTPPSGERVVAPGGGRTKLWCDFLELPFETQSVDLLVLPHTLEFTRDPHGLLREAGRVLVPEGRVIILGFNTLSLWGVRHSIGRMRGGSFAPASQDPIAFTRLKDWIKLLGFELSRGRFGCYRPPLATDRWLDRYAFMEAAGDRWWPIFGAVYMVSAVKRVRGMRLVGPKRAKKFAAAPAIAPIATPRPRVHTPAIPADEPLPPRAA